MTLAKKRKPGKGRITPALLAAILNEIEAYRCGDRPGRLAWRALIEYSGFSQVALWKNSAIRLAFQAAKYDMREDATIQIKPRKTADDRIVAMQTEVARLKEVVRHYDEEWLLHEYNIHRMGLNADELRRPLDSTARNVSRVRSTRRARNIRRGTP